MNPSAISEAINNLRAASEALSRNITGGNDANTSEGTRHEGKKKKHTVKKFQSRSQR